MKLRIQLGLLDDYKTVVIPIRDKGDITNIIETLTKMERYL